MTPNPLDHLIRRRAVHVGEQVMEEHGWGTHLTFETTRRNGQRLCFQMRLPDGMEMVEFGKLAEAARGAPAFVGHTATVLEQAREQAGVIVVGGLRGTAVPEAEREVMATLTVALAELPGPFNVEDFMPADSPSTVHSKQEVVQMSEHVSRIHRLSVESPGDGREPVPMLMIEYLFQNRYGVLALAFTTQREDMISSGPVRDIFDAINRTAFIGEEPAAI